MKEVTRVHIAKTAYDIELSAKKRLEKYIKSLDMYTQDEDVLSDVEIRMTEILAERSVAPGGVISDDDVDAIRAQLGEPHEFAGEGGDIAVGAVSEGSGVEYRRYYRNLDNAVVGGVLSGVATYFGFNPLWARLAFIVLIIVSWGAALLVYVVLWIAVPPAKTAAERLQLSGKPVNLAAIRELNEAQPSYENSSAKAFRKFLRVSFGFAAIGASLLSFAITLWGAIGLAWGTSSDSPLGNLIPGVTPTAWTIYVLAVLSGLLLTTFFAALSYAVLSKSWTKKIITVLIGVVVAGLITSTGAITAGMVYGWQQQSQYRESIVETKAKLPENFKNVKTLTVFTGAESSSYEGSADVRLRYVVDDREAPSYHLTAPKGVKPNVQLLEDGSARISVRVPQNINYYEQPEIVVRGPALDELKMERGYASYHNTSQENFTISGLVAAVSVTGRYANVKVTGTGDINVGDATIENLTIESKPGSFVTVGVVRTLNVSQPDVCPVSYNDWQSRVSVVAVNSDEMIYNGANTKVETKNNHCSLFVVGGKEMNYEDYRYNQ